MKIKHIFGNIKSNNLPLMKEKELKASGGLILYIHGDLEVVTNEKTLEYNRNGANKNKNLSIMKSSSTVSKLA